MYAGFDIVVSRAVSAREVEEVVRQLLPGAAVAVTPGLGHPPEDPAVVWVVLGETEDPDWPCVISLVTLPDGAPLGKYPDLTLAESMCPRLGLKALCDTSGLVPGLHPQDPYWSLVWDGGSWYLADTSETRLMGPYTDGTTTFPGDEPVRLKCRVDLADRDSSAAG